MEHIYLSVELLDTVEGQLEQMGAAEGPVAVGSNERENHAGLARQLQPHLGRFSIPRGSVGGSATNEFDRDLFDQTSWFSDCQGQGKESDEGSASGVSDEANAVIEVDQNSCKDANHSASEVQEKEAHWGNKFSGASDGTNAPSQLANRQAPIKTSDPSTRLRAVLAIINSNIDCVDAALTREATGPQVIEPTGASGRASDIPRSGEWVPRSRSLFSRRTDRMEAQSRIQSVSARPKKEIDIPGLLFETHARLTSYLDEFLVNLLKRDNMNYEVSENIRFRNTKAVVGVSSSIRRIDWLREVGTLLGKDQQLVLTAMTMRCYDNILEKKKRWLDYEIQKVTTLVNRLFSQMGTFYKMLPKRSSKVSLVKPATLLIDVSHLLNAFTLSILRRNKLHRDFQAIQSTCERVSKWVTKEGADIIETLKAESQCRKIEMGKLKETYPEANERAQSNDVPSGMVMRAGAGGSGFSAHGRKNPGLARLCTAPELEHLREDLLGLNERGNFAEQPPSSTSLVPVARQPAPNAHQPAPNANASRPLVTTNQQQAYTEADFMNLVAKKAENYINQMLADGPEALLGPPCVEK